MCSMFYHDVGISLEYEDWNNNIRSPITCVVTVELVTCRGKVKDGTTFGWRTNDVTRALIKVYTAQESNQCIVQMYVQADMYKCMSVWAAWMCLYTFALIRWYIEGQYTY